MSIGAEILDALKTRLQSITVANGYGVTIKKVLKDSSIPTLGLAEGEMPCIEIVDEREDYEHQMSSSYWANQTITLYITAAKFYTDTQMQDIMSNIRRALYGGAPDASGNTGMTLGGKVESIRLLGAASDLNMVESNRVYIMQILLRSHRTTFRD